MRLEAATVESINPQEFISAVGPSLHSGNLEQALDYVRSRWSGRQIVELLQYKCPEVRKVAALSLSVVGDRSAVGPLAVALHDTETAVSDVAEHALWSIWFRIGKPSAVSLVKCGNNHMHHGNYDCAIEKFTQAIRENEDFAEAYNQRAIAYYLSERFEASIENCKLALTRMPQHFGAMSGMGHCHAHLEQWRQARHCYRLALAIHPRLEGIQTSLDQIDQLLRDNPCIS